MTFCILTTRNHPHDDAIPPLYLTVEDDALFAALKAACEKSDGLWTLEIPRREPTTLATLADVDALSQRWNMGLSRRVAEQLGIAEQTQKQAAIKAKVLASGLLDAEELALLSAIDWSAEAPPTT